MLRAGVLGLGRMGRRHARCYTLVRGVELVALCDHKIQTSSDLADDLGGTAFASLDVLLREAGVDVVSVAVPTSAHPAPVVECARRRVHVLVEKPLAFEWAEARSMVTSAEENGVVLGVAHTERFNPAFKKMRSLVADGLLGDIAAIRAVRFAAQDDSSHYGPVAVDLMVHDLDLVFALVDADHPVERVRTEGTEASAEACLDFASGVTASLSARRGTGPIARRFEVHGRAGALVADLLEPRLFFHGEKGDSEVPLDPGPDPLTACIADFVRAVTEGQAPEVSGADSLKALDLALTIDGAESPARGVAT